MNVKDLMAACPNLEVVMVGDKPAAAKAPVDVLAVMESVESRASFECRCHSTNACMYCEWASDLRKARAAAAELVEAAKKARRFIANVPTDAQLDAPMTATPNDTGRCVWAALESAITKFGGAK